VLFLAADATERESGSRLDLSRAVFYGLLFVSVIGLSFAVGLQAGARRNALFRAADFVKTRVETSLSIIRDEASTLTGTRPSHFLQRSRDERRGVTVNDASVDQRELVLVAGFFGSSNGLRLLRRTGEIVAQWPVQYYELFPDPTFLEGGDPPATNWNIDTHGAIALGDGSVVFTFEKGGVAKLDRCGAVVWTARRRTHHSIVRAEAGGYWVPSRRFVDDGTSPFPPFEIPFNEDTVLKISEDGQVESEFSVPKIFYDNGLEAVLTAGQDFRRIKGWELEILHLNSVHELPTDLAADFPMFAAGDLLLSIRGRNLVMVVDKTGTNVKWWKVGPWVRQHDAEFRRGGTISVFNNNVYRPAFDRDESLPPVTWSRWASNIMEIDPATNETRVIYGGREAQPLQTTLRGKAHPTQAGGFLVTEFEGGRVFELDASGRIVWEFVNRYSEEYVAEITDARVYPADHFRQVDWSCQQAE
jgi:hypothetical protein